MALAAAGLEPGGGLLLSAPDCEPLAVPMPEPELRTFLASLAGVTRRVLWTRAWCSDLVA